ncbi:MAG: hypothetical protein J6Y78_08525 [Paludibacteraceae bacterium]|nr:hypothetical protein [Paludibacteraceae bacterium]
MKGTVTAIKTSRRKYYGYIESGNSYFYFNLKDCTNYIGYKVGDSVNFDVSGDRAVNVRKIIY